MPAPGDEYELLYEAASDVLFSTTLSGELTRVNRAFERVLGLNRLDVIGSSIYDWIVTGHRELFRQSVLERIGGAAPRPFEVEMSGTTGPVPIEVTVDLVFDAGNPTGLHAVARDITDQVRSRLDMAAANETLFRQTAQLATFSRYLKFLHRLSTTAYPTVGELYSEYLRTGCSIFRLDSGAIVETHSDTYVVAQTTGAANEVIVEALASKTLRSQMTLVGQLPGKETGGASFYAAAPIMIGDDVVGALLFWSEQNGEHGTHPHAREIMEMMARGIATAIQQRRLTEELEYRAQHDGLTGLPNVLSFHERLRAEVDHARQHGSILGLMFVDLDRFKVINDSLGHAAGDDALRQIGQRLRDAATKGDLLIARVGGDEFGVVVPGRKDNNEVMAAARAVLVHLANPVELADGPHTIAASIGVSIFPYDGDDETTLLSRADAAMYEGKREGGNCVRRAGTAQDAD